MTQGDPTPLAQKRWLSPIEAAEYIGVSDRTIRNYTRDGILTAHHVTPKLVRFDREQVDAAIRERAS